MRKTFLVIVTVAVLFYSHTTFAATIAPVDAPVTISVGVGNEIVVPPEGETVFELFGFTSPGARVIIQNPGIHNETFADAQGSFRFKYLLISQFKEDICLVAFDTQNRSTPPLCVPPPGSNSTISQIGPILLPPSTSISIGDAYIGDTVTLSGQTIPNVDVKLSMFTDELQQNKNIALIPEAMAYTIPTLDLQSDAKGNYSLSLPTSGSQFLRMFSRAFYKGNSTPKGLTLALNIYPIWMLLFKFISSFFTILKAHIIDLIILTQLYFLLLYVLKRFLHPHFLTHQRRLLAKRDVALVSIPHELMKFPHNLPTRITRIQNNF